MVSSVAGVRLVQGLAYVQVQELKKPRHDVAFCFTCFLLQAAAPEMPGNPLPSFGGNPPA